jgi:hypothetical protein
MDRLEYANFIQPKHFLFINFQWIEKVAVVDDLIFKVNIVFSFIFVNLPQSFEYVLTLLLAQCLQIGPQLLKGDFLFAILSVLLIKGILL